MSDGGEYPQAGWPSVSAGPTAEHAATDDAPIDRPTAVGPGAPSARRRRRPRARLVRRIAASVVAVVVVMVLVVVGIGVHTVRQSFPPTTGTLHLAGLSAPVTVIRDAKGVPQIYASTPDDLFEAQGYVAAQDRFFQMDLRRHITAGRLSELVGSAGLETDKVVRTLGWRRTAQAELGSLDPTTVSYLRAYSAGVNAYITSRGSPARMSLEYSVLGQRISNYKVAPWTPVDSLAWLGAMAWDLRSDYDSELERARLAGTMSIAHIKALYPAYSTKTNPPILSSKDWKPRAAAAGDLTSAPGLASTSTSTSTSTPSSAPSSATSSTPSSTPTSATLPPSTPLGAGSAGASPTTQAASNRNPATATKATQAAYASVSRALAAVPAVLGKGDAVGSNSFVISGKHTATGKPLLANDPHLEMGIPGIWYQSGLHCRTLSAACPFDVTGFTFAGLPGVVIGHNQSIAWGFTNLGPDVSDLYLEQILGTKYLRDGVFVPLHTRRERILVSGGKPVTITVRSTVHGPILSDVIPQVRQAGATAPIDGRHNVTRYAVSLAWTGLVPNHTADSIFELDSATNWGQFRSAARHFAVPAQNLVYADTKGNIGYQAPGLIPIRESAVKGSPPGYWPAPGWNSAYDWKGYVPFDQMPHVLNPPEGMIVTANQEVTASSRPFLTTEWDYGYRSQRMLQLLRTDGKVSPAEAGHIQMDTRNQFAPTLVKYFLAINLRRDAFTRDGQKLLRHWNFTSPASGPQSAAAAYYNAVWSNLLRLTFDDELPRDLYASGGSQWFAVVNRLLTLPHDPWWDNKSTPGVIESRNEILREAMVDARLELTKTLGKDPTGWKWGDLHQLELRSQVLGGDGVPAIVHTLFNRGPWQMPGASSVVDANGGELSDGYTVDVGPSMRMVVDLSDLDASRWVNQTGSSGHAYDAHYDDQVKAWVNGETYAWPFSAAAVKQAGKDILTLQPTG